MMGPVAQLCRPGTFGPGTFDAEQVRADLDMVHRNGLRLSRLVTTLLDFSRIHAGRLRATFEPVDLATLTMELASAFRSALARAGLDYEVDCAPLGEPVYLDRSMWEQVVFNLLSNAVKFTLDGQVRVSLRREAPPGRSAPAAVLEVTDTGIGIGASELPRLFERFHRIEHTQARSMEGSGIGLALAKELVELHGGTISPRSANPTRARRSP